MADGTVHPDLAMARRAAALAVGSDAGRFALRRLEAAVRADERRSVARYLADLGLGSPGLDACTACGNWRCLACGGTRAEARRTSGRTCCPLCAGTAGVFTDTWHRPGTKIARRHAPEVQP